MLVKMSKTGFEIVYEGWLTKSPPTKSIWKARWRKRWFVLRSSGELPGQFFLLYYTDRNCRKLKGTIDLDQCEQVDAGLRFESNKQNYPHMFDIKTPKRTYYLAADSESDMNRWVDCICQVCALKATHEDTSVEVTEVNESMVSPSSVNDVESPPISPASTISGPYIPISECISGKPLNTPIGLSDFNYIISKQLTENSARCNSKDSFNKLTQTQTMKHKTPSTSTSRDTNMKKTICSDDISKSNKNVTLVMTLPKNNSIERINSTYGGKKVNEQKKVSNIESAKKMEEMYLEITNDKCYDLPRKIILDVKDNENIPEPNWETFPNDIGSWSVQERFGKLQVVESKAPVVTNSLHRNFKQKQPFDTMSLGRPPPRPPKPSHLSFPEVHHYTNLESVSPNTPSSTAEVTSDEMYDFPRSHQPSERPINRHNYSNAALAPSPSGNVFRYDFDAQILEHTSLLNGVYSNLPSPLVTPGEMPTPPAVNRDLKPTRKQSDSGASNEPSPGGPFTPSFLLPEPSPTISINNFIPPSIDRKLKPRKLRAEVLKLAPPPGVQRKIRGAPSPTPPYGTCGLPTLRNGRHRVECSSSEEDHRYSPDDEPYYFFEGKNNCYIPADRKNGEIQYLDLDLDSDINTNGSLSSIPSPPAKGSTVYKTVDFLKTEAFNRTRQKVEEERKQCVGD